MLYLEYFHRYTLQSDNLFWRENHYSISQISPNQPNPMGEIAHFTSQNTGGPGLLLPRPVHLFVPLLCDFGESKLTF